MDKFDKFCQNLLITTPQSAQLPKSCSVFDVYVDLITGNIQRWYEKRQEKARNPVKSYTVLPHVRELGSVDVVLS